MLVTRFWLAVRAFFQILLRASLTADIQEALGIRRTSRVAQAAAPAAKPSEGALQMLSILQRDSRLIDFLMEDISGYPDEQVGAAVRNVHSQCRESLAHYVQLVPVIDGVEGTFTTVTDPSAVKFLGNVPPDGRPSGGVLRHKGWRAVKADLPPRPSGQDANVVAPAEIEIE